MKKHVIYTWEWGTGNGHLRRFLPIARSLTKSGFRVTLVVRETTRARHLYAGMDLGIMAAPQGAQIHRPVLQAPQSFAGIAWNLGLGDYQLVMDSLARWKFLFESLRPTHVISDFGVFSGFIAKSMHLPLARIGLGFGTPPSDRTLYGFWEAPVPDEELAYAIRGLAHVQRAAKALGLPAPKAWEQLFPKADLTILATIPELDPYREYRNSSDYFGAWSLNDGDLPSFNNGEGRRVIAYLKSDDLLVERCRALTDCGLNVHLVCDGAIPLELKKIPRLSVSNNLLSLGGAGPAFDAVICNANHGITYRATQLCKPVIMFPKFIEQRWNATVVEKLGFGTNLSERHSSSWCGQIHDLFDCLGKSRRYLDFSRRLDRRYGESLTKAINSVTAWLKQR